MDLFSGIGGISIALKEWVRPIAYCEIDPYCQGVLLSRISDRILSFAPIWDDIKTLSTNNLLACVDIIYGGFPCQDISIAGNGVGLAGERSGLFFQIMRLAEEIKPKFIFLENVPAITARGGITVSTHIAEMGYDCRWCVIPASAVGALHKRERWFMLAYSKSQRCQERGQPIGETARQSRLNSMREHEPWSQEPESKLELVRVANGLSCRVDRVKALGNGVVPCQAKTAFKILMGLH